MDYVKEIAHSRAKQKLKQIIARFGDESGERLKPYYINQLISEEILSLQAENSLLNQYLGKEKALTDMESVRA